MNEGVRIAGEVLGGMPRPPDVEVAKNAVQQQGPGVLGVGVIGAMLGIADDDIGRTACRLVEAVCGAMHMLPEEEEHVCGGDTIVDFDHGDDGLRATRIEAEPRANARLVPLL